MKTSLRTVFFLLAACAGLRLANAQAVDSGFPITDFYQPATIQAALRQADGKYIISGNFTKVATAATTSLVRLNADGSLDAAFGTTAAVENAPTSLRLLPSGRLLLFGPGTLTVAGQTFRNLVQLNLDGTLGPALATGTGSSGQSRVVAVQPDGKYLIGGSFTAFNGVAAANFVRLNADGSVDTQFTVNQGTGFTGEVTTMLVQPDGKILVGGRFQDFNGTGRRLLVRLLADGTYDAGFTPVLNGPSYAYVAHLAIDPRNNNVVVEGSGLQNQSGTFRSLLRLTPSGVEDTQFFAGSGQTNCYSTYTGNDQMLVDSQGRILFGGCFENFYGSPARVNSSLVRLLPSGAVDPQFTTGPSLLGTVNSVLLQPDGSVLVAGNLKNAFTTKGVSVVRLTGSAQLDPGFQTEALTTGYVARVLDQPDGKILVAGRFTNINGQPASNLARFNVDGTRDTTFPATGPDYTVGALALQPDGRILIGGSFKTVADNPAPVVARLQSSGAYDPTFVTSYVPNGSASSVDAIAVQPDGKVLTGGSTLTFTGTFGSSLHRLLPNGQTDQAYETNITAASSQIQVLCLTPLADGRVYAGGFFSAFNAPRYNSPALIRLNSDGTLDSTFVLPTSTTQSSVLQVLPLTGGQVLAAGRFSDYNGVLRTNMVRLNANGSVDTGFNANLSFANLAGADITCVVPQPNGRLLIGSGIPIRINGVSYGPLARLLPDGTLDASFAASANLPNGSVYGMLLQQPAGRVILAGRFTQVAGQPRVSLACITAPNVLHVAASHATEAATFAWPVPTHGTLHLQADATARPSRATLLTLTGQAVLRQSLSGTSKTHFDLDGLAPGLYLLRVDYADGPVTRRVVVE